MSRYTHDIPRDPLKYLWYISKQKKWPMIGAFGFASIATLIGLMVTYMTKVIVDSIETGGASADHIWQPVILLIIGYLLINPLWRTSGLFGSLWAEGCWKISYDTLFARLIRHSDTYFQSRFAGAVTNKIHHVAQGLFDIYVNVLWGIYVGFLEMIFAMILVFFHSTLVGFLFAIWTIVFFILLRLFVPRGNKLAYQASETYSRLKGISVDIINNASSVRQFTKFDREVATIEEASESCRRADIHSWWYGELIRFVFMFLNHGISVGVLVLGVFLWLGDQISAGDMLLFYWLAHRISEILRGFGNEMSGMMRSYGQIQEGLDEILIEYDVYDRSEAPTLRVSDGLIVLEHVKFAYTDSVVFQDLNLAIPAGQKVGLVGRSGAGKSTLIQLLLRQYDISAGRIMFDDQNIASVSLDSIRESIAVIPQDPSLFHRSIRDNIAYARHNPSDEDIQNSSRLAQAHDFICELPQGYDTLVGERGIKLSGGQRQRVIIARALLKNAPILILDEATSSLDSESEHKIQQALVQLMKGKTVIAVAHRLSTLKHMDRILVLQDGKIIEDGSHQELLAREGLYAQLWSHQAGGFINEDA